jgi:hypothetical protein
MLKPTIKLSANADAAKVKELIEKAEANCLISNSTKAKVSLEATIRQQDGGSLVVLLLAEQRMGWSLMIFCARATRGLRRPSLDARSGRSISPHP